MVLNTARRLTVGAAAAGVVGALVLGLPWALITHVGWPLPDRLPAMRDLTTALASPFSTRALLDILACLCWLTWALFVVDLVRCVVAVLRGGDARTGGLIARIAGMLAAAIVIAATGSRSASAHPAQQPASVTALTTEAPTSVVVTETVQPPLNGVNDSLWRVAERIWGDGTRWPELFAQNRGVAQPDGQALTIPDHVRPGWRLTATIPAPTPPAPPPAPSIPKPPHRSAERPSEETQPGFELPTGAYVSLTLAAAVGGAVTIVRMRHRRRYRVGSRDRSDLERPPGPVVRALLIPATETKPSPISPEGALPLGVRDGRQRAVDILTTDGIGLVGPGRAAAARAILLHLLTAPRATQVFIPKPDVASLFADLPQFPANLVITGSTATALDEIEEAIPRRTQQGNEGRIVFLGTPSDSADRLTTLLKSGLGAVVLGQWHAGTTLQVGHDGIVTTPDWDGTRLFSLPDADAAELLELLRTAGTDEPPAAPGEPETPRATPSATRRLHLKIVGRMHLEHVGEDLVHAIAPKQRELLVYLALHPDGARRDTLIATIWPDAPGHRPGNTFHATLSQLRRALRKASGGAIENITVTHDGHYALDPAFVEVDLWALRDALDNSADPDRLLDLYRGELGEGLGPEWLITHREELRRDILDALDGIKGNVGNEERQLQILERMRRIDRYNESICQDIIAIQRRLGRTEAVSGTIALLEANLAEIGENPTPETLGAARTR